MIPVATCLRRVVSARLSCALLASPSHDACVSTVTFRGAACCSSHARSAAAPLVEDPAAGASLPSESVNRGSGGLGAPST